ncbi:MAG: lytic transglycosylase domain-containing protein [Sulfuricurvum sp.]
MKNILYALILLCVLGTTLAYASPSSPALNASLSSIGSEESFEEIEALANVRDEYASSYASYYKRYQATQTAYRHIEEKFKKENIPLFFSLIPYCESKFNPRSRGSGTAGLWQFTVKSAKNFGLSVKKGKDERLDIDDSTDAAIRYIKSLKKEFGNWYLADFAYGMGEGKLRRLIEKNGSKKISVLLKDPHFPSGTKSHFAKTLLLDATIHYGKSKEEPTVRPEPTNG